MRTMLGNRDDMLDFAGHIQSDASLFRYAGQPYGAGDGARDFGFGGERRGSAMVTGRQLARLEVCGTAARGRGALG